MIATVAVVRGREIYDAYRVKAKSLRVGGGVSHLSPRGLAYLEGYMMETE